MAMIMIIMAVVNDDNVKDDDYGDSDGDSGDDDGVMIIAITIWL